MTVILYLLAVSLVLGGCGLAVFLWSLRTGQYEDMEGAANRILFDDPEPLKAGKRGADSARPVATFPASTAPSFADARPARAGGPSLVSE